VHSGFIICCWLLYNRMFPTYDPSLALRFYAVKRTKNQKGVTIPSQIRYVIYFARWLRFERGLARFPAIPARNPVLLQTIRLLGIPRATTGKDVWFKLVQNDGTKYSSKGKAALERRLAEDYLLFQARDASGQGITALDADCNITFYCGGMFDTTKLFQFWFNTRMIGVLESAAREGNSDAEQEVRQWRDTGRCEGRDCGWLDGDASSCRSPSSAPCCARACSPRSTTSPALALSSSPRPSWTRRARTCTTSFTQTRSESNSSSRRREGRCGRDQTKADRARPLFAEASARLYVPSLLPHLAQRVVHCTPQPMRQDTCTAFLFSFPFAAFFHSCVVHLGPLALLFL